MTSTGVTFKRFLSKEIWYHSDSDQSGYVCFATIVWKWVIIILNAIKTCLVKVHIQVKSYNPFCFCFTKYSIYKELKKKKKKNHDIVGSWQWEETLSFGTWLTKKIFSSRNEFQLSMFCTNLYKRCMFV